MNLRAGERPMLPVIAAAWLVAIYGSTILVWFVTILLLADPVLFVPGLMYACTCCPACCRIARMALLLLTLRLCTVPGST